jgi:hypothetical protein
MQLPGELVSLLSMLGYSWPEADEEKLFDLGNVWTRYAGTLSTAVQDADSAAQSVWQTNRGDAVTAFQRAWTDHEAPVANLRDGADGANLIGIGLMVAAGVVLVLKINMIVQLTLLAIEVAQVIATAGPTFGASLLEIPIFKGDHRSAGQRADQPGPADAARWVEASAAGPGSPGRRRSTRARPPAGCSRSWART